MSHPSFTYTSWALCPESSNLEINQEKLFFTLDDIDIPPPDQDQSDKHHGIEQITHDFIDLESSGMVRKCCLCLAEKTPQWREGPLGPKTLCNACWVRFKSCSQYCEAEKTPKWRESAEIKPMPFQPCDDHVSGDNHGTIEQITNFIDSSGADKIQRTKRRMKQENQNVPNCFQNNMAWKCCHCLAEKTPQWQEGPLGPKTLCNACGERFKSGRLAQQSRPAESSTFDVEKHSNFHRKKMKIEPA